MFKWLRPYLSLIFLLFPAILFGLLLLVFKEHPRLNLSTSFPFFPWQFWILVFCGSIATTGGVLDWLYHRDPLKLKLSAKERDAEAKALGLGGIPMFILMWCAMLNENPHYFLIPIIIVLIYTVVAISYDEFVFHIHRCGKTENLYHRMLVFGNGMAWLAWFHFIYYQ